jgi:hypothetical protein
MSAVIHTLLHVSGTSGLPAACFCTCAGACAFCNNPVRGDTIDKQTLSSIIQGCNMSGHSYMLCDVSEPQAALQPVSCMLYSALVHLHNPVHADNRQQDSCHRLYC